MKRQFDITTFAKKHLFRKENSKEVNSWRTSKWNAIVIFANFWTWISPVVQSKSRTKSRRMNFLNGAGVYLSRVEYLPIFWLISRSISIDSTRERLSLASRRIKRLVFFSFFHYYKKDLKDISWTSGYVLFWKCEDNDARNRLESVRRILIEIQPGSCHLILIRFEHDYDAYGRGIDDFRVENADGTNERPFEGE